MTAVVVMAAKGIAEQMGKIGAVVIMAVTVHSHVLKLLMQRMSHRPDSLERDEPHEEDQECATHGAR